MNDDQAYLNANSGSRLAILKKLYLNKCGQIEQARLSADHFRCQVLKAEAEIIKAELAKD